MTETWGKNTLKGEYLCAFPGHDINVAGRKVKKKGGGKCFEYEEDPSSDEEIEENRENVQEEVVSKLGAIGTKKEGEFSGCKIMS